MKKDEQVPRRLGRGPRRSLLLCPITKNAPGSECQGRPGPQPRGCCMQFRPSGDGSISTLPVATITSLGQVCQRKIKPPGWALCTGRAKIEGRGAKSEERGAPCSMRRYCTAAAHRTKRASPLAPRSTLHAPRSSLLAPYSPGRDVGRMPACNATDTAPARLLTRSFCRMWSTCFLTVLGVIRSASPIWRLV